jgi:alpha-tubulin suppressor-like RCC1 family protein
VTKTGKVYGCGSNSKGQLGFKGDASNKLIGKPVEIKIVQEAQTSEKLKAEVISVKGGSLYSMAICRTEPLSKK